MRTLFLILISFCCAAQSQKLRWLNVTNGVVIPAPFAITSIAISASSIKVWWNDLGYNYNLQRATDAAFTLNLTTVYSGSAITFTDTGLSANTTYYYRVQSNSSGFLSQFTGCNSTTWAVAPTAYYSMEGGDWYGLTNNSYAQFTGNQCTALLDISGNSAPTFTASTGNLTYDTRTNRRAAIAAQPNPSVYTSSTDIVLSGDFCVAMYLEPTSASAVQSIMGNASDNAHVDINTVKTFLQTKVNGSFYDLPFGATVPTGSLTKIVWKRVGNQASASLDGGFTYGTSVTTSTADVHINKFFQSDVGSNMIAWTMFAFFSGNVLTGAQLAQFFEPYKQANYTVGTPITVNPTFTGSWSNLTNGSPSFTGVSVQDNGSFAWKRAWSSGNYAFIKYTKDATASYSDQGLYLFNHLTGQYSPATDLPVYYNDTDLHIQSSLLLWDNTVWQVGLDRWYSPSINTFKLREFGQSYDIRRYTQKLIDGSITNVHSSYNGYYQATSLGNIVAVLMQKFTTYADGLKVMWSTDRMNFWQIAQPVTTTNPTWVYPILLNNGTLNTFYFVLIEHNSSTIKYPSISLLKTTDFSTFSNIDGSYSFIYSAANLVNLTTVISNAAIRTTGSCTSKNVPPGNFAIDANAFVYGIHGNCEDTGWEVSYYNSGWQHAAVSFPTAQAVVLPPSGAGTNFNRVSPCVFKDDTDVTNNTFIVFALCDPASDGNYRVGKFTTSNLFASQMTFAGYVSTDNTKKHWNLQSDFNYHFNNHAVLVGTQVNGTAALDWVYQIK